jgi:hypothetical protein
MTPHTHIPADKLKKLGHAITVCGLAGSWRTDHQLSEHHRILLQNLHCVCVFVSVFVSRFFFKPIQSSCFPSSLQQLQTLNPNTISTAENRKP